MEDIDLVAMYGTKFMRVQVKASNLTGTADRYPTYYFSTRTKGRGEITQVYVDIVALVAIDLRKVIFMVPDELKKTTRIVPLRYDQIDIERITWDNAVAKILGEAHVICSGAEVA